VVSSKVKKEDEVFPETSYWYTFCRLSLIVILSIFIQMFLVSSRKRHLFCKNAYRPFRVVQDRWFWYESKARNATSY